MQKPSSQDLVFDSVCQSEVTEAVLKALRDAYVFPEVAGKMEAFIRTQIDQDRYASITSASELANVLTQDLRSICKDKHLQVVYSPKRIPIRSKEDEPTEEEKAKYRSFLESVNYGFREVRVLPGNLGFVRFDSFAYLDWAAEKVVSVMSFLAHTDALLFDIRENEGGDPAMVAFLSSYLFDSKPVHLNSLYWREGDRMEHWWTLPYIPGKRTPDRLVYVLTSSQTFSAAEEFAYNLKSLKRALIVGEKTSGGAHPIKDCRVHEHFCVYVPVGRAVNPITQSNWEGVGVVPDVEVPKEEALRVAQISALQSLEQRITHPAKLESIKCALRTLKN